MWECEYCHTENHIDKERCIECGAPKLKKRFYYINVGDMSQKDAEKALKSVKKNWLKRMRDYEYDM